MRPGPMLGSLCGWSAGGGCGWWCGARFVWPVPGILGALVGAGGPYQDRPPLCPFRLLPLLIYFGSVIAFLKFQGPKSKSIENKILLQP